MDCHCAEREQCALNITLNCGVNCGLTRQDTLTNSQ